MFEFLTVLAFALLPAGGVITGGLLAEGLHTPKWVVGASLHGAAGIAIALICIDLMPRILETTPIWLMVLGFLVGGAVSVVLAWVGEWSRLRLGMGSVGAWMVYMAVAADLTSDGLTTGVGSAVSHKLGLLLAATQAIANIPGGFAATANFRDDGMPRRRRLLLSVSLAVPALASALIGYSALRGQDPFVQNTALAFIIGILLLATVEDVLPEGDAPKPPRWISTAAFAGGFAAMALMSTFLR